MFCPNCGKEVDNVKYCPYCGTDLSQYMTEDKATNDSKIYDYYDPIDSNRDYQYQNNYQNNNYPAEDDAPSTGFAILSFLFPIVGLILYILWHKDYPLKAKSCLKGIIIGFVLEIILSCCLFSTITDMVDDSSPFDDYDIYEKYQDQSHHLDFGDYLDL